MNKAFLRRLVFVGLVLAGPGAASAFAQNAAPQLRSNEQVLREKMTFTVKVEPVDPFHPAFEKDSKEPVSVRPGELFRVTIHGQPIGKNHTYPATRRTADMAEAQVSTIEYKFGDASFKPLWPIRESDPERVMRDGQVFLEHDKPFTWSQDVLVLPEAKLGPCFFQVQINLQVCDDQTCLNPGLAYTPLSANVLVAGLAGELTPELKKRLEEKRPATLVFPTAARAVELVPVLALPTNASTDLLGLLAAAATGAFLMLLTPCVFPMIPITVNFFLKQAEKEHHSPLLMASVYAGTIILLLTGVMVSVGQLVVAWAINPWFNLALGVLLVAFALSLFGMFEIQLPSSLARVTMTGEGRGGYVGAVFMALTFTITSFTCTGPFLGAMLAPVASVQPAFGHLVLAMLVYSFVFAAPFFVLALFPSLMKKLPKSGGWMDAVKVTMGFLELGAALKFLSNADFGLFRNPMLFTYDSVLCAWIALSVACGLYLIGLFRLPHHGPVESIGVLRMVIATIFFGLAVYMTPLLSRRTPEGVVGQAIVAFLPLSQEEPAVFGNGGRELSRELTWIKNNFPEAWKEAKRDNKDIFIDFTGVTCVNCRANEKNVFTRPDVRAALDKYVRVQLYTDIVQDRNLTEAQAKELVQKHQRWQEAFNNTTLPLYIVLRPDAKESAREDRILGQELGRESGVITNVPAFLRILEEPQGRVAMAKAE